jgi:hypothetical protein
MLVQRVQPRRILARLESLSILMAILLAHACESLRSDIG